MNTKTFFSKQLVILSLLISFFNYANSPKVEKIIQTSEFKNFAKFHKLSENEIAAREIKTQKLNDLNCNVSTIVLDNNNILYFIENQSDNSMTYLYSKHNNENFIIFDKNGQVMNSLFFADTLQCTKDTFNYMKKACDANTTCSITCDLSPNCIAYMYAVAYAHCATGGKAPKALSSSIEASSID